MRKRKTILLIFIIIFFLLSLYNCASFTPKLKFPFTESFNKNFESKNIIPDLNDNKAYSIAIQEDGKIVVAGTQSNGQNSDFAIVRYNNDGSLDKTFGMNGVVTTNINTIDYINSIALQKDQKIVVAGTTCYDINYNYYEFALARYNIDGSLDTTFHDNGIVVSSIDINGNNVDFANSLKIDNKGKIIIAGGSFSGANFDFAIERFNNDGSYDKSFNDWGKDTEQINIMDDYATSLALQKDGKIVVAGNSIIYFGNKEYSDFALIRYNIDATLDRNFGDNGKVITKFENGYAKANSVLIQNDGKIIVSGFCNNGNDKDFAIVRYKNNGSLDPDFGNEGKVKTDICNKDNSITSSALQKDGKIVVAGYCNNEKNYDFVIARYNIDGTLDTSFGKNGIVITDIGNRDNYATSLSIQADGKIIVAGTSYNGKNYDFAVVRYNYDGSLDFTFGKDGIVTTDF